MSDTVLRVGAIGAGDHAVTTIWPLLAPAGLRLDAVSSRSIDKARRAAAPFGVGQFFDDPVEMLASVELDGVILVVAPTMYASLLPLAIDRGLPTFIEKPGAASVDEARSLAAHAHAAGVPVVVGFQKRFASAYRQARGLLSSEDFGTLSLLSLTWAMGPFEGRFSIRDWLIENAIHHFDLARYMSGDLSGLTVHAASIGAEFAVVVTGRSTAGTLVTIRANTTSSWVQHNESLEAFGVGHGLLVDNLDTLIHRPPERPERVWRPNYTVPAVANFSGELLGYGAEIRHFRDVATGSAANLSDLANAAATLALVGEIASLAEASQASSVVSPG